MYIVIILILVAIITILEKKLNEKEKTAEPVIQAEKEINYNEKYIKKDYLLTKEELKFYKLIKPIVQNMGYSLFCQVSLYEIIKAKEFKNFNKIKSKSIDFVITQENCKILMCIELDDTTHQKQNRIQRDDFLNKLFQNLQIKLLRIPVQNFYNIKEIEELIKESL